MTNPVQTAPGVAALPTYHDLHITTPTIPRTSIFNLPFGVQVMCTRVAGWEAWAMASEGLPEKLLGGEYGGNDKWLVLDVAGHVICDGRRNCGGDD